MFKRLLSRTLAASALTASLMLCASTTARAAEGDEFTDGNLKFIVLSEKDHTVAVKGYVEKPVGELVIPSQANNGTPDYTVTQIAGEAFRNCSEVSTVSLPSTLTYIGYSAFYGCSKIESIDIPDSVTEIGWSAFMWCKSLKSVSLPNSLRIIPGQIFWNCFNLETVNIPETVTSIEQYAFLSCTSLLIERIPELVTKIGDSAFSGCQSITSLKIPDSVTEIEAFAFANCTGLTSVKLPENLLTIPKGTFELCTSLTELTIPESVTSIGRCAFGRSGLEAIEISAHIDEIGGGAFSGCYNLEKISIAEGNSKYSSVDGVLFDYFGTLISFSGPRTEYIIPDFCTGFAEFSFCYSSLKSIEIPNDITTLSDRMFLGCDSLANIVIPNSITMIEDGAFYSIDSLTSFTLPESVRWVDDSFCYCRALKKFFVLSQTPPNISYRTFADTSEDLTIYVPEGSLNAYTSAEYWSELTNYVEMPPFTLTLSEELAVEMGQTAVLTAQIEKADDVTVESESWLSFNSEVATVDENGVVTGVAEGTALIACTVVDSFGCDHREFCKVTVTPTSGIGSIEATGSDTPAVYYNLNGVRVDGNALTPGFYIKRQGTKAEKILVK